ncbi:MAG TPA: FAD-dependent oxidoreductase [Chitinophagaceae bacterium]|nr:FAD-dependent oxidoreductase [Chitinophagaceae bacterium]
MQKTLHLQLLPSEAASEPAIKKAIADAVSADREAITGYNLLKKSVDARSHEPKIIIQLRAFINEPWQVPLIEKPLYKDTRHAKKSVVIIGAGPAGLFAALRLIASGIRPIILERGKDVKSRRRDLATLNKKGEMNPESNYCFGEGGAGTYSDGKLYTRSTKRGDVHRVLQEFVYFGADHNILYEAHPHIGTNKLPSIITAIREKITACGGEYHFEKKVTDLIIEKDKMTGVTTQTGELYRGDAFILATGHSARDIFRLLSDKKIAIEFKPFALGVRVEHPQDLIDSARYHCKTRNEFLPPASYSWVEKTADASAFSFCMCPGGIIAPASTAPGELVVNGWSPSKRNNPFANSGIVVPVEEKNVQSFKQHGPFAGMYFQQSIEQNAFQAGGGRMVAPAQRLVDFTKAKLSGSLPGCSYLPGIHSALLKDILPGFIYRSIQQGIIEFGKKMKGWGGRDGYFTNEAVVVATESRTSSPVRVPRDPGSLEHPQIRGLFPCGEGAGYAGGIISAAMDGEKVADRIILSLI